MRPQLTFLLPLCLMLPACGMRMPGVDDLPGLQPYRINVQQGNALTQDMVARLKPGMTRSQVRFVLGTPVVQDAFHANRWDYLYMFTEGRKETRSRRLTVIFEDDKLLRLEGDVVGRPVGDAAPAEAAR
jgi:outer membrane protein assembly factor BamE